GQTLIRRAAMFRSIHISVLAAIAAGMIACTSDSAEETAPSAAQIADTSVSTAESIVDREWMFIEAGGEEISPPSEEARAAILTLETEESRALGATGCNQMGGSYTMDGSSLSFSEMVSTRMACEARVMDQETRVHAALDSTRSWSMQGDTLIFWNDGAVTARLVPRS